VFRM